MTQAAAPIHSDRWYRVARLRPRLAPSARFCRQMVRGEAWQLLSSADGGTATRLDPAAWSFVGRCDGRRSVAAIWERIVATQADDAPTQDEIIGLMIRLHEQDLIDFDSRHDIEALDRRRRDRRRRSERSKLNPLSFRVKLGDPRTLLDRLAFLQQALFSRTALAIWLLVLVAGLMGAVAHWDELAEHASHWLSSPRYLLIAWACYPPIKLIHELAHGLALRRWGAEVREVGLALVFLTPLPYVDASEAALLPRRHQRCVVSGAGIAAELAIAALSLLGWTVLEPGVLRDVLFSVALTSSLSTLLFNANPLMRLDGYHLLTDLCGLPNLASRSAAWWQGLIARHGLGLKERSAALRPAPSEKPWLVLYWPLSWAYRLLASAWLVLLAGASHPMLGWLAGLLMTVMVLVLPLWHGMRRLLQMLPADGRRYRGRLRLLACTAAALAALTLIPVPDRLVAEGVIWLPEEAHLRAGTDGFLTALAADGAGVRAGDEVATLSSIELDAELQALLQRRQGLMTGVYQSLVADPYQARQIHDEMAGLDQQIRLLGERRGELVVRSASAGRLAVARPEDAAGRYFARGGEIGLIETDRPAVVRVAVAQEDAARLARAARPQLRLAWAGGKTFEGRILRIDPAASDRLPSRALGIAAGGSVLTDPQDPDGLRTARPVRLVDVEVPLNAQGAAGSRAWVRFDLGRRSLASQAIHLGRQLLLLRFSPVES